jgi:hypothetical protein
MLFILGGLFFSHHGSEEVSLPALTCSLRKGNMFATGIDELNTCKSAPSSEVCSGLDRQTEGRDLRALHCLRGLTLRR